MTFWYDCNKWYLIWRFFVRIIFIRTKWSTRDVIVFEQCRIISSNVFHNRFVTNSSSSSNLTMFWVNFFRSNFIKYRCHLVRFNHEFISLISFFAINRAFFSFVVFHVWIIVFLTCCHMKTMFRICRESTSFAKDTSTTKYCDSCRLRKNSWHRIMIHDSNFCLSLLSLLMLSLRFCLNQSYFCLQWFRIFLILRQIYWHFVKFVWYNKSSSWTNKTKIIVSI